MKAQAPGLDAVHANTHNNLPKRLLQWVSVPQRPNGAFVLLVLLGRYEFDFHQRTRTGKAGNLYS